jgi:poly(beta-D-mannuronate) lyase
MKITKKAFALFVVAIAWQSLAARTVNVSSLQELAEAISKASPGDRIVLADGAHTSSRAIPIQCAGTAEDPILIEAQSVGGAEIQGKGGFTFEPPAARVVLRGFKFTHAAGAMNLPPATHHCRITRNVFQLAIEKEKRGAFLTVGGDDHEIDHNAFQHKDTEGQMLYVQGPGTSGMAQRTWIHHNYFFDFKPSGANNSSALHIGHSARSLSSAHAVVEHNLFVQCRGENEGAICNKSGDNIYRYNTFGEGSTELSLRHGNRCLVYGNYFVASTGLRFFGDDHRIFSNYFERCRPAIAIGNGGATIPPAPLTSHDRPDGVQVVCNTLVHNRSNVQMTRRNNGLGANDLVFANNLIVGGNPVVSIDGPLANPKWEGNIVWANEGGTGDLPEDGFLAIDPMLKAGENGVYRVTPGSPALGKGVGEYLFVTHDMDGQIRPPKLSVGADQLSDQPSINRLLTARDVGPGAPEKERPKPTLRP